MKFKLAFIVLIIYRIHQRYSAYSGTARLAKRWLSCQMMSDYISDEAIDLVVASLFLCPHPFTVPRYLVQFYILRKMQHNVDIAVSTFFR